MAFDFHLNFPEESHQARVLEVVAAQNHISLDEAAKKVFEDGLRVQLPLHTTGDIWGLGEMDSDVLDEVVSDAVAERLSRYSRRLNA